MSKKVVCYVARSLGHALQRTALVIMLVVLAGSRLSAFTVVWHAGDTYDDIQRALNNAEMGPDRVVQLQVGTYLINQALQIPPGVTLKGDSMMGTVIKLNPSPTRDGVVHFVDTPPVPSGELEACQGDYLFSVGLEFVDELNRGVVSAALQEQFRINGRALMPPSRVEMQRVGSRWRIIDQAGSNFYVQNEDGTLNVYKGARNQGHTIEPAAAIRNKKSIWFSQYWESQGDPASWPSWYCQTHADDDLIAGPVDTNLSLTDVTVDCNTAQIWPRIQFDEGNAGCLDFARVTGLTIKNVTVMNGNVDGLLLGSGPFDVSGFSILNSRIQNNGRFGIGWIMANHGMMDSSIVSGNVSGGLDLEPIAVGDAPIQSVTISNSRFHGLRRGDVGVGLNFFQGQMNQDIHFVDVTIDNFALACFQISGTGEYDNISLSGTMQDCLSGFYSDNIWDDPSKKRGRVRVSGQFIRTGVEPDGSPSGGFAPIDLQGRGYGWELGPILSCQPANWGNASNVVFRAGHTGHYVNRYNLQLNCDPGAAACQTAFNRWIYWYGQPDGSLRGSEIRVDPFKKIEYVSNSDCRPYELADRWPLPAP